MRKSKLEKELTSILSKKKLPKKDLGGILSGAGSMAGTGFMVGGPVGAGVGAVAGGIMGLLQANAQKRQLEKQKQLEDEGIRKQQMFMNRQADRQILSSFPTNGINQSYFNMGGNISPEYEAETKEVIEFNPLDKPKMHENGKLKQHSSTTATIDGKSHEQGGEAMSGGERIYSDEGIFPKGIAKELYKILKNY